MSTKLYVGNLPYSTTDEELRKLFSEHGNVESAVVIIDKFSGRSRGFGFVEMSTEEEGNNAVNAMNEKEVDGRNLKVNVARPKMPRTGAGSYDR